MSSGIGGAGGLLSQPLPDAQSRTYCLSKLGWPLEGYAPGRGQPSFDKQYVRDWASGTGWDRDPPAPPIPGDVVARARELDDAESHWIS